LQILENFVYQLTRLRNLTSPAVSEFSFHVQTKPKNSVVICSESQINNL